MSLLTWLRALVHRPAPPPRARAPFPRGTCPACGKRIALRRDGMTLWKHACIDDLLAPGEPSSADPVRSPDTLSGSGEGEA